MADDIQHEHLPRVRYSGFCVGGIDRPHPELADISSDEERMNILRRIAKEEARSVHELGGNLIRLFYSMNTLCLLDAEEIGLVFPRSLRASPGMNQASAEERIERLDRIDALLADLSASSGAFSLEPLDAYIAGVEDLNEEIRDKAAHVRVLLTLVSIPPRWLLEAPSSSLLGARGRTYTFESLWADYLTVHRAVHQELVRRHVTRPTRDGKAPVVCGFEVGNEPDYCWIPAEMKIELGAEDWPLWKYVTELHLAQIPTRQGPPPPSQQSATSRQAMELEWVAVDEKTTPVVEFDWGSKFDWYVRCFADLHQCIAEALAAEPSSEQLPLDIVSGGVTHNNIDYLLHMVRENPATFDRVTGIGIHPYHWVNHDVWNDRYVDSGDATGWHAVSPREFARVYLKRFDFLEQFAASLRGGPAERRFSGGEDLAQAFAGKSLWITEFGIGAKTLGAFNSPIAEHTKFIRPQAEVGVAGGYDARIWEDLWDSFLHQVNADYLDTHGVRCLAIYALREFGAPGVDMHDDDRSNFALLRRDATPKVAPPTLRRLQKLLASFAGRLDEPPAGGERPYAELHRRPWRTTEVPDSVFEPLTMLSSEERRLLFWLAAEHYEGEGAIVDAGCFVGGSTVALASGLRANPSAPADARIDVFDRFETEPYMIGSYFEADELGPGDSFRPIFEENTRSFKDLLTVHAGDLATQGWDGRPIEILFVDIAKSWELNDVVVREFFPCLIPGRSALIQQDLVFSSCHWVPITMELLDEYFEPVSFVEYNSLVFVCRKPVPRKLASPSIADLSADTKIALLERAIERFRGYPRGLLELAMASLLLELGDHEGAQAQISKVADECESEPVVTQAINVMAETAKAVPVPSGAEV